MKNKFLILLTSSLIIFGCGDNNGSSSSITLDSATAPASLSAGTVIAGNPSITLTAALADGGTVTATYENTATGSLYPSAAAVGGTIDVEMNLDGTNVKLSFTAAAKAIEWVMSDFLDRGGDGHTDEFTLTASIDGTSQGSSVGQFVGGVKPKNENVADSARADITGAPTEEEFQKSLVGFAILASSNTGDLYYVSFSNSTDVKIIGGGETETATYTYSYTGGNKGSLSMNGTTTGDFGTLPYSEKVEITFNNFYEGSWQSIERVVDGIQDNDLENGTFKVFSGTDNLQNFIP